MNGKLIIGITMGDINGIGPEIIGKVLCKREIYRFCTPVIFGNIQAYQFYNGHRAGLPRPVRIQKPEEIPESDDYIAFVELEFSDLPIVPGTIFPENSISATAWIREAVRWTMNGDLDAIVTAPITKEGLARAGIPYDGHTTMLADWTQTRIYRMTLFTRGKWVVHHTAHLALKEAIERLNQDELVQTIELGYQTLRKMNEPQPRIAVAGINPHAGEQGLFGNEELEIIQPAIFTCQQRGIPCSGPYPPDTVFRRLFQDEFSMVIAMYHDQGHIPIKLFAMHDAVQLTLGLPVVRTSVDHGTAFDIAGQDRANERSLENAIQLAVRLANTRHSPGS